MHENEGPRHRGGVLLSFTVREPFLHWKRLTHYWTHVRRCADPRNREGETHMRHRFWVGSAIATALTATILASGCSPTTNVTATNGPLPDTITSIGIGTGTAAPDQVAISFGVNARAKTGPAAMDSCTKATNRIVDALKAAGVEEKEIRTLQISLYPMRDNSGRKVVSYQANQSILVTTKKIDKAGDIITTGTTAGASDVSGPDYTMTSENAARADSISKAIADAKARAVAMAKASGRDLGPVLSVQETTSAGGSSPYYDQAIRGGIAYSLSAAMPALKTLPGQRDVQTQVSVVFRLK
jgi:uncharacterized protein